MYQQKRPKPGEDEEAILALEKDFISSVQSRQGKFQPAATAVRKDKKGTKEGINTTGPVETTPSTQNKQTGDQTDVGCESDDEKIEGTGTEASAIDDENEVVIQNTIVERAFDASKLMVFSTAQQPLASAKTIGKSLFSKGVVLPNSRTPRKSMFAQMFDAQHPENNHATSMPEATSSLVDSGTTQLLTESVPSSSKAKPPVIGGMIHPYLTGMTQAEIMVEQEKLVQTLDPRLVEFVRSRQVKKQVIIDSNDKMEYELPMKSPTSRNSDKVVNDVHFPTIPDHYRVDESDLPIDPKSVISFPGMGHLESEKLEWAGVVKENRKKYDKLGEGENARFDFRGMLLTGKELEDTNTFEKGLHHHGEDMEKPGYTLEELLTLSRSVNSQQKAQALLTIGNIYENAHTGMYDFVLEKSLFDLWEYMDFVYALRKGLDEGDKTSINEAVHCLSNIMYPWEEEFCLDFVHSWEYSKPYPWISTKSRNLADSLDPGEDEVDLKDEEMLKIDFLEFFINRSNLLDRIAYFLKGEDCLSEKGTTGIFKMLIRIARHSPNVLVNHEVLSIIVKNYISPVWISSTAPTLQGVPVWMAFKIFRILIDSSSANADKIYEHYNIFPSVISYLAFDDWKSLAVQGPQFIIIESFRIWIGFISHGIAIEEYRSFFPVLMKFFVLYQTIDQLSSFDLMHSGYVFTLLLAVLKMRDETFDVREQDKHSHWTLVKDCVEWVEKTTIKLMTIISSPHLEAAYDQTTLFWSLSKALLFLTESTKYSDQQISEALITVMKLFLSTTVYGRITSQLREHSVILSSQDTSSRYPSNFASVNALYFGGNCNPVIVFGNALAFLTSLYGFIRCCTTDRIPLSTVINTNVDEYVNDLLNSTLSKLPPSFFVRYELIIILRLLELYPLNSPIRFCLAYRAASETPKCCAKLFNNLFQIALYSSCDESEILMCNKIYGGYLLLDEAPSIPSTKTAADDDTADVPKKKVKFSNDTKATDGPATVNFLFEKWSERSLETYWILEPLQRIRTIVSSAPGFLSKNLEEIEMQCKICLQLIDKCLQKYSDFVIRTKKDFLEVYCAVCQVFLMGDPRIYIGGSISAALVRILNSLLTCSVLRKFETKGIFSTHSQVHGLPNMFLDFYPDLISEYSENSYFNEIFANYLMLPLRIPEDARLRSNFWIMETIHFMKISNSTSLIPLEYLTSGIESNSTLLHIYLQLLHSGQITKNRNEFLFNVITTNIQNALNSASVDDSDGKLDQLKETFLQLKI